MFRVVRFISCWQQRGYAVAVLLEQRGGQLLAHNRAVITAAQQLSPDGQVVGVSIASADAVADLPLSKLIQLKTKSSLPEDWCPTLAALQAQHGLSHWLVANSTWGRSLMPRLGGTLLAQPLPHAMFSDICAVESGTRFKRPIYAGSILATVESKAPLTLLTVRTTAFPAAKAGTTKPAVEQIELVPPSSPSLTRFVGSETAEAGSKRPELTAAKIVVSGGRALKSKENFQLVEQLADKLGAAVGASRAAVDAGYCPNDWQVGQTGKQVAPDLYLAIGISGAIQHVAGMKDSRVIVAINKDAEAPIFQIADYGLVGDLFKILPELTSKLKP